MTPLRPCKSDGVFLLTPAPVGSDRKVTENDVRRNTQSGLPNLMHCWSPSLLVCLSIYLCLWLSLTLSLPHCVSDCLSHSISPSLCLWLPLTRSLRPSLIMCMIVSLIVSHNISSSNTMGQVWAIMFRVFPNASEVCFSSQDHDMTCWESSLRWEWSKSEMANYLLTTTCY